MNLNNHCYNTYSRANNRRVCVDGESVRKYYHDNDDDDVDDTSVGPCSFRCVTNEAWPPRHLRRLLVRRPQLRRRRRQQRSLEGSVVMVASLLLVLLCRLDASTGRSRHDCRRSLGGWVEAAAATLSPTTTSMQDLRVSSHRSWALLPQKRRNSHERWIASSSLSSSDHHHARFGRIAQWLPPFRTHRSEQGTSDWSSLIPAGLEAHVATLRNHSLTDGAPAGPNVRTLIRTRIDTTLSSLWSLVTGVVTTVSQTPRPWGQYAVTTCQVVIVLYLLSALWNELASAVKTIGSTLESEVSSESPPLVTNTEQVRSIVDFLELLETFDRSLQERDALVQKRDVTLAKLRQDSTLTTDELAAAVAAAAATVDPLPEGIKTPWGGGGGGGGGGSAITDVRVRRAEPLVQLGQRLHTAGLPWRGPVTDASIGSSLIDNRDDACTTRPSVESVLLQLTKTEAALVRQCLWIPPSPPPFQENGTTRDDMWDSVMGLDAIKDRMMATLSTILSPGGPNSNHAYASLFGNTAQQSSSLTVGLLLYGPPGCGKTLLVKALSSKARLPCLVITPSVLLRKYVGDTNQQVRALFTLASKLAPCIVCIDELDGLFRERSDTEHEVSRDLKTEFLQWLDGMTVGTTAETSTESTARNGRHSILVIGATNRPFDVDSALLRRLPHSICVKLPDDVGRSQVLQKLLESVPTTSNLEIATIAQRTELYSPSDLRQVLQMAALLGPMKRSGLGDLTTEDIVSALDVVPPTTLSQQYLKQLSQFMERQPAGTTIMASSTLPAPSSTWSNFAPLVVTHLDTGTDKWETAVGNFYNVGTLEIDTETFNLLNEIVQQNIDWEDNDTTNNDTDDL